MTGRLEDLVNAPGAAASQPQPMTDADSAPADGGPPPSYTRRTGEPTPAERVRLAELGAILRSVREAAGLSLADLEPIAGARGSLAEVERGTMRTRPSRIRAWCGALGLEADAIIVDFADVIAPERPDGPTWHPVVRPPPEPRLPPRRPAGPPPLPAHARAAIAAELWTLRERRGLSRKELGRAIGVSRPWISILERGLRPIDSEHLERWLVAVDATATDRLLLAWRYPGWVPIRREAPAVGRSPAGRFVRKIAPPLAIPPVDDGQQEVMHIDSEESED